MTEEIENAKTLKQSKIGQGSEEEVDLERDENDQSLMKRSELDQAKGTSKEDEQNNNTTVGERNKKFLLNELQQIKDQMYGKLMFFKARSQGKKNSPKPKESELNQFVIEDQ